ncbi:MAG: hypothetical protein QW764_02525 [Desulfurococcaceae archaeon]
MKAKSIVLITALFSLAFGQSLDEAVEKGLRESQKAQEEQAKKEAEKEKEIHEALSKCTPFDKTGFNPAQFIVFHPDILGYALKQEGAKVRSFEARTSSVQITHSGEGIRQSEVAYKTYLVEVPLSFKEFLDNAYRTLSTAGGITYAEEDRLSRLAYARNIFRVKIEENRRASTRSFDGVLKREVKNISFRSPTTTYVRETLELPGTFLIPEVVKAPDGKPIKWNFPDAVIAVYKDYKSKYCAFWDKQNMGFFTTIYQMVDWRGDGFGLYRILSPWGSFDFKGEAIKKDTYGDLGLVFEIGYNKYYCYNKKVLEEVKNSEFFRNYSSVLSSSGLPLSPLLYFTCGRTPGLIYASTMAKVSSPSFMDLFSFKGFTAPDPNTRSRTLESISNAIKQSYPNVLCLEFSDMVCTLDKELLWDAQYFEQNLKRGVYEKMQDVKIGKGLDTLIGFLELIREGEAKNEK